MDDRTDGQVPGAPARPSGRRALRPSRDEVGNPGTAAFWLTDIKIPVITEPSPVLGASPPPAAPVPPAAPAAAAWAAPPDVPPAAAPADRPAPAPMPAPTPAPRPAASRPVRPASLPVQRPNRPVAPPPTPAPDPSPVVQPLPGSTSRPKTNGRAADTWSARGTSSGRDTAPQPTPADPPPTAPAPTLVPKFVTRPAPTPARKAGPLGPTAPGARPRPLRRRSSGPHAVLEADLDAPPAPVPASAASGLRGSLSRRARRRGATPRPSAGTLLPDLTRRLGVLLRAPAGTTVTGRVRRIRAGSVLAVVGAVLVAIGIAVPFLLSGLPFGHDSVTVIPRSPTSSGSPSGPRSPAAGDPSESPTRGGRTTTSPVPTGGAPVAAPTVTVTRTRSPRTVAAPTPAASSAPSRTASRTATPAATPTRPAPSTRPGEVYVDPATYVGRPRADVRTDLTGRGLVPLDNWVSGTGRPYGTVVDVRPSGWVRDHAVVDVRIAVS